MSETRIDELISKAWHYFEKFVVSGPSSARIRSSLEDGQEEERDELHTEVADKVRTLLYLREIGASDRLAFRSDNWLYCYKHTRKRAVELGLSEAADNKLRKRLVDQLAQEAQITPKLRYGSWDVYVSHPLMPEPMWYTFDKRPTRHAVAEYVFDVYRSGSIVDFIKARTLNLPLATSAHSAWLRRTGQSNSSAIEERAGRVALRLEIPTIKGLPAKELIKILEDQRPEFVQFQAALRKAIHEAIGKLDLRSDKEIADSVVRDFIEPELMKIQAGLHRSNRNFSKKLAAGAAVGSTITTVGLLGAMPLVIGAGIAAGATVLPQLYKHWDDKDTVKTSDMYFLWGLQKKKARRN